MTSVVVDASTALAWCFPDEQSGYADSILTALEHHTILVPALWSLEIANAVLVGERKKRLTQIEIHSFVTLLDNLSVIQDTRPVSDNLQTVIPLARAHGLSAYDASYLELAIRRSAGLATLDAKLQKAAIGAGIELFPAGRGTAGKPQPKSRR